MTNTQLRQNREAEDIKPWLLARPGLGKQIQLDNNRVHIGHAGTSPGHHLSSSIISSHHQPEQDMYQTVADMDNRYRTYTEQKKKKTNSKENIIMEYLYNIHIHRAP